MTNWNGIDKLVFKGQLKSTFEDGQFKFNGAEAGSKEEKLNAIFSVLAGKEGETGKLDTKKEQLYAKKLHAIFVRGDFANNEKEINQLKDITDANLLMKKIDEINKEMYNNAIRALGNKIPKEEVQEALKDGNFNTIEIQGGDKLWNIAADILLAQNPEFKNKPKNERHAEINRMIAKINLMNLTEGEKDLLDKFNAGDTIKTVKVPTAQQTDDVDNENKIQDKTGYTDNTGKSQKLANTGGGNGNIKGADSGDETIDVEIMAKAISAEQVNTAKENATKKTVAEGETLLSIATANLRAAGKDKPTPEEINGEVALIVAMNDLKQDFKVGEEILLPKHEQTQPVNKQQNAGTQQQEEIEVVNGTSNFNLEKQLAAMTAKQEAHEVVTMQLEANEKRIATVEAGKNMKFDLGETIVDKDGTKTLKTIAQSQEQTVKNLEVYFGQLANVKDENGELLYGKEPPVNCETFADAAICNIEDSYLTEEQLKEVYTKIGEIKDKNINSLAEGLNLRVTPDINLESLLSEIKNEDDLKNKQKLVTELYDNIVAAEKELNVYLETYNANVAANNANIGRDLKTIEDYENTREEKEAQGYNVDEQITKVNAAIERAKQDNKNYLEYIIQARALKTSLEQMRNAIADEKKELESAVKTLNDIDEFDEAAEKHAKRMHTKETIDRNNKKVASDVAHSNAKIAANSQGRADKGVVSARWDERSEKVIKNKEATATKKRDKANKADGIQDEKFRAYTVAQTKVEKYDEAVVDLENMKDQTKREQILELKSKIDTQRSDVKDRTVARMDEEGNLQIKHNGIVYTGDNIEAFLANKVTDVDLEAIPVRRADEFKAFIDKHMPEHLKGHYEVIVDKANKVRKVVVDGKEYTQDKDIAQLLNTPEPMPETPEDIIGYDVVAIHQVAVALGTEVNSIDTIRAQFVVDDKTDTVKFAGVVYNKAELEELLKSKDLVNEMVKTYATFAADKDIGPMIDKVQLKIEGNKAVIYLDGQKLETQEEIYEKLNIEV